MRRIHPCHREGRAMAVVNDILYVFGGRGADGKDLDDLAAFNLNSQSPLPLLRHFRGLPKLG